MKKPEWIEHDGSNNCPVPKNNQVQVRYHPKWGDTFGIEPFRNHASHCTWQWITHYRDWTAFEQGEDEVPEWAIKRALSELNVGGQPVCHVVRGFARYIAAHEPEPDPLEQGRAQDCGVGL